MNKLLFNRWTLTFDNKEYEDLYEIEMSKYRLQYFRIIEIVIMLLCFYFFTIYLIDGQHVFLIITLAVSGAFILGVLIITQKFDKKIRYYYFFTYLISITISVYVATQTKQKALYLYGFYSGSISVIQYLFSNFRLRILAFVLVPTVQLYIMDALTSQDFSYIILVFTSQFLVIVYSHYNEFMYRLAFSHMHYNIKLKEILDEYVPNCFFAISLNQHNNQFQLEFVNQQGKAQFNIEDTKSMIDILRNIYVGHKSQINTIIDLSQIQMCKSGDISTKKVQMKRQTLEEYSFYKIKQNLQIINDDLKIIEQLDGVYFDNQKQKTSILNIDIRQLSYGKNYLLFVLKEEKPQQMMSKSEEQIKFLNKIVIFVTNQLFASLSQLSSSIQTLNSTTLDNERIRSILCLNLSIMNQFQNFYYFVNSCKIDNESVNYKVVNLKKFINNLEPYFSYMSNASKKIFVIQMNIEEFNIKINSKFLSQIIVNIFEQCLSQADVNTTIELTITTEANLNPLRQENNQQERCSIQEFDFIQKVAVESEESPTKTEVQKLIKFEFSFLSEKQIELQPKNQLILNPQTFEDFQFNNNQEFLLIYPITNFLLKKIGPYNAVQEFQYINCQKNLTSKQVINIFPSMMDLFSAQHLYQNKLSFYIYSDQTLLTQSFIKYVKQKSFLDY
ncbi:unnamed protein product [Paramecium sonneborni]|uniref:Transmembrane protein n=1 Tax=Paramecium sonneborni TaxID=65129 RepID=A0A8S1L0N7_9CILI|nr:unnamed protein product [Paramecium sonneborni]